MFHSFIAAITSFFLSFVQQPAQVTKPDNSTASSTFATSTQQNNSYFYYDNEDHIRVHLYIGDNSGIDTATAQKNYFFQGNISVEGCLVERIEPDIRTEIDITGKSYVDFGVQFVAPCSAQRVVVTGEKIIQNSVIVNDQNYTSTKRVSFGPVVVSSKILDAGVFIQLAGDTQTLTLQAQETKNVYIRIVDKNDAQIDPKKIESISVRTLDSSKLQFLDSNGTLTSIIDVVSPKDSSIEVSLKSLGISGIAGFEVVARIKGVKTVFTAKQEFSVTVEKSPIVDVQIELEPQQQTMVAGNVYYVKYSIKNGQEPLTFEEIDKIEIAIKNGEIIYQNQYLTTLNIYDAQNPGVIYIKPLEVQKNVELLLKLYLYNGKIIEKKANFVVVDNPLLQISINPVKTEYSVSNNLYTSYFVVNVQGGQPFERYSVDVITPKILYPTAYYDGFISGALDYENKYVFYNGIKRGDYSGKVEVANEKSLFSSYKFDLYQVEVGMDKLIILPNKYKTDTSILGNWNIIDMNDGKLILSENVQKSQDRLSFVIGSQVRYDPIHYTLATMTIDSVDHTYRLDENSSFLFSVTYPPFMVGKDIFIGVHKIDSEKRVGNSLKYTLQGTGLSYPEEFTCDNRSVCTWRITIKQQDSNERLSYSRIEHNCQVSKGSYKLLTSYKMYQNGCDGYLAARELKTDDKGYVYLCIYPDVIYKEVDTNETSGGTIIKVPDGYETATVTCEFAIDEEFPY